LVFLLIVGHSQIGGLLGLNQRKPTYGNSKSDKSVD
jgi:hypothetical protein